LELHVSREAASKAYWSFYQGELFLSKSPIVFKTIHTVSFLELDPFGHMNTVNYLSHFLDHRFAGMREQLGLDLASIGKLPFIFVTRSLNLEFLRPVFGDERLSLSSWITSHSESDCNVIFEMRNSKETLVARCGLVLTCVNKQTSERSAWPADFIELFYELKNS
jgi:acyl-CoA thioester hydrolase